MVMVSVVNWQPTGGFMVQADRLGPKVGGHLAPCCTHRVNQGELSQCCFQHNDSTINIVLVLLLLHSIFHNCLFMNLIRCYSMGLFI